MKNLLCFFCLFFFIKLDHNFLLETAELVYEEFEDTKGAIRILISKKNRQTNRQKRTKGKTTIYKTYT